MLVLDWTCSKRRATGKVTTREFLDPLNLSAVGFVCSARQRLILDGHANSVGNRPAVGIIEPEALEVDAQNLRQLLPVRLSLVL